MTPETKCRFIPTQISELSYALTDSTSKSRPCKAPRKLNQILIPRRCAAQTFHKMPLLAIVLAMTGHETTENKRLVEHTLIPGNVLSGSPPTAYQDL